MAHSVDLRERVVEFAEQGGSKSEAARRFQVSRWCAYDWLERECLQAAKTGPKQPSRLAPDLLKTHVEEYPDAYQYISKSSFRFLKRIACMWMKPALMLP